MKVLHVETGRHLYGGAQQVLYLAAGLQSRGIRTILVCTPDSAIRAPAEEAGIDTRTIGCSGDLDLGFSWRLRGLLMQEHPDVVHCHSRRGADFLGGQAALMAGVPAVLSRRVDHDENALVSALRFRPYRKVVAISETVARALARNGVSKDRVEVIRSAVDAESMSVDPDQDAFRSEFDLGQDDLVIAAVGQLIPRKGHRFLLEALARLRSSHPQLRVIVFGSGRLEADLKSLASKLDLGNSVRFAGFRQDLDSFMACFDLLVHTSLQEGLGIAMLKAAAAGIAVVAFDAAGAQEAVIDGETGVLTAPEDVDALSAAIAGLLDDPDTRHRFGERGRQRMLADFSPDVMVEKHIALYRRIGQQQPLARSR